MDTFWKETSMDISIDKLTLYILRQFKETREFWNCQFPYDFLPIEYGIMYLGFKLKPNNYGIKGWTWLEDRIVGRIDSWCNRWFSKGVD